MTYFQLPFRGHLVFVDGSGHIPFWQPLYKSEGAAQVCMIVLTFLLTLVVPLGKKVWSKIFLVSHKLISNIV